MTQKELLYVEDAISHEKIIIDVCNDLLTHIDDDNIADFINNEISNHESLKENLLNMLEAKSNG